LRNLLAVCAAVAVSAFAHTASAASATKKDAQVTQIIREVNLLPSKAQARPAAVNDHVTEGEAVRTGDQSRSELTFIDLTITRLGANSLFSFNKAGRDVRLDSGSVLLRVPKESGGAGIHTSAVSVAITGTTVILEGGGSGRSKLIVLEGGAQMSLVKYPKQSKRVRAGQMLDVPAGATTLPDPVDIDLKEVMRTHPLITDFRPLPSYPLIVAAADQQGPIYQGRPVAGAPGLRGILPPWIATPGGPRRPGGSTQQPPGTVPPRGGKPGTGGGVSGVGTAQPPVTAQPPPQLPPSIGRAAGSRAPSRARSTPTPPPIR
jgi:hypothetical protein